MTCIVGMYYNESKGALIVSDSRVMIGSEYATEQKIFQILDNVVLAASGLSGITGKLIPKIHQRAMRSPSLEEIIDIAEDEFCDIQYRYKNPKQPRFPSDETLVDAIVVGLENGTPKLYCVHENGYAEEVRNYRSTGDGSRFANQILKSLYHPDISKNRAMEIAVHTIMQVSKLDAVVDANAQLAVIEGDRAQILNMDERGNFNVFNNEINEITKKINGIEEKRSIVFNLLLDGSTEVKEQLSKAIEQYLKSQKTMER